MNAPAPLSWPCPLCDRPCNGPVHEGCQAKVDENLTALPALYVQLADALYPGRRGGDGRTGTRTAPLPCNEEALDLRSRGGIAGVLSGWTLDLYEREGWQSFPVFGSVETAVTEYAKILRINLPWIIDQHPAAREFADEVRLIAGQARRLVTGETPPRRVTVSCPCGGTMRVTLDTPGARCPGCSTQYGHTEVLQLPAAERRTAA
ncbi:hypothetical protein [Streptomyces sp. NPDC002994]|uniref:hypothetical protein n=1 Tax=Streptomyces sp. NPDC002994 TaxID=3154441 RepID=UPI0033AB160D